MPAGTRAHTARRAHHEPARCAARCRAVHPPRTASTAVTICSFVQTKLAAILLSISVHVCTMEYKKGQHTTEGVLMLASELTVSSPRVSTNATHDTPTMQRLAKCFVLVACCCLIPTPARGEMLLAELSFTAPEPVAAPASFRFGVGNDFADPPLVFNWFDNVASYPFMSMADAATVSEFDRLLTMSAAPDHVSIGFSNGPYDPPRPNPFARFFIDRAFEGAYVDIGLTATRYAEHLLDSPFALQWYALTAVERSVTPTVQTIRIFGYPDPPPRIPEPRTAMLVLCAALLHFSRCWPCSIGGCHRRTYRKL